MASRPVRRPVSHRLIVGHAISATESAVDNGLYTQLQQLKNKKHRSNNN